MEEKQSPDSQQRCVVCKETSDGKILLHGLDHNREVWVCVHCLPMLIHGAH